MITQIRSFHPTSRLGYVGFIVGEYSEPVIYVPRVHEGFPVYESYEEAAAQLVPGLLVEGRDSLLTHAMVLHETE